MLASFADSVRITAPKKATWRPCTCGALAPMSPTKNACTHVAGGRAASRKTAARSRGRN